MTILTDKSKTIWILIPIFGSLLFIVLYMIAAFLYPGGSETDKTSIGFNWTSNYWCNLIHENAINGQSNTGRTFAITAMFILCLSLSTFWFVFPKHINANKYLRLTIQTTGIASMLSSFFLLTKINHDLIVNIASSLGFVATIGTLVCLYQTKWQWLFAFGLLNVFLVGLNNYLYHTEGMMIYLPVVQKISFLSFLVWICFISINHYHRSVKVPKKLI